MNADREASVIANELDNRRYRIGELPDHPRFAEARKLVVRARDALRVAVNDRQRNADLQDSIRKLILAGRKEKADAAS